ncbi:MAG: 2-C-methyl-D-erythritol 2,4-cyclodiphosphate synthase [Planctomycetota bacterium]|nr:MAG: 2-C-methyl-D-erythritol 2,4-cyclodiphosphate synthase [Planctomycetota bacterium]
MNAGFRIGSGFDRHRLVAGRPFLLGGVRVAAEFGPEGHSDGDVLLHALTDALLGAVGLGDIGEWFSDRDPRWKDADSTRFVTVALEAVRERGWQVGNVDATIFLERPRLAPYKPQIRDRLAGLLRVDVECVNLKAKTGEAVGAVGRGEAVDAHVAVLLVRDSAAA